MRIISVAARTLRWTIAGEGAARGQTERAALLLEVRSDTGAVGLGEAAPLPGMSRDTLADARAAVAALAARVPLEVADRDAAFEIAAAVAQAAAARFAIETALLDALARERGISLAAVLCTAPGPRVALAAVVDDPDSARRAVAAGVRCLKIKVGLADDPGRVRAIAAAAPGTTLRIDANRSWPRSAVAARLAALAGLPIEYVEEPCVHAHLLLAEPLPCKLALDESLAELSSDEIDAALHAPQLAAIVLKPTLLGGLSAALALAARARDAGVAAIVSHGLEGPIGTAACAELALALAGDRAVGLARHSAIADWRIDVAQLAADHVRPALAPGLGFAALDLAIAVNACTRAVADAADHAFDATPAEAALSVTDAARSAPDRIAIETASRALTFAECAAAIAAGSAARRTQGSAARGRASVVVATPTITTVLAIHAALEAHRPIALLHHRVADDELQRQRALVERSKLPADTAILLFTSGSTGAARGVVLSRSALVAAATASARHLGWRDDDRWLLALSLAHAGGLSIAIRCLAARRPIVLCDRDFDRDFVAQLLERCTLASLVPTQLAALIDDPAWRPPPRLRAVLLGGAAAPPPLLERAAQRGVRFLTTYGMTESLGQLATAPLERAGDPHAPLVPLDGVAFTAGSEPAPAPIAVRAPMLATCYLDGEPIAPAFTTADLGYLFGGTLRVTGRRDDVIVTGGENVHPSAIEAVLAATPGVRAACAFGVPDERWGQVVGAALITTATFDLPAAAAHWRAALPTHARPRRIAIRATLPVLPSGKVDRRAAAQLAFTTVDYSH